MYFSYFFEKGDFDRPENPRELEKDIYPQILKVAQTI
jgi:hypothetical protein